MCKVMVWVGGDGEGGREGGGESEDGVALVLADDPGSMTGEGCGGSVQPGRQHTHCKHAPGGYLQPVHQHIQTALGGREGGNLTSYYTGYCAVTEEWKNGAAPLHFFLKSFPLT